MFPLLHEKGVGVHNESVVLRARHERLHYFGCLEQDYALVQYIRQVEGTRSNLSAAPEGPHAAPLHLQDLGTGRWETALCVCVCVCE